MAARPRRARGDFENSARAQSARGFHSDSSVHNLLLMGAAYDELLCTWSRRGHWRRCAMIMGEIRDAGVRSSAKAFSACCVCFVEAGRWSLVISTLDAMRTAGIAPVAGMFRALDRARRLGAGTVDVDDTSPHWTDTELGVAAQSRREAEYAAAMEYLFAHQPQPLDIQFEDSDVIVVNKPVECVVQPGRAWRYWSGTLAHAVLAHCCRSGQPDQPSDWRPTVVHRLDKGTSGVMVLAKTELAARSLRLAFAERTVHRVYQALLHCSPPGEDGRLETLIGPDQSANSRRMMVLPLTTTTAGTGKFAASRYRCLERLACDKLSLVEFKLETGRTHQVRVHAAALGCPLAGDSTYDPNVEDRVLQAIEAGMSTESLEALVLLEQHGQQLHAGELGLTHPRSGEWMRFTAPLPPAFEHILCLLRQNQIRSSENGTGSRTKTSIDNSDDKVAEKQ